MGANLGRTCLISCIATIVVGCAPQGESISNGEVKQRLSAIERQRMADADSTPKAAPPADRLAWRPARENTLIDESRSTAAGPEVPADYSLADLATESATTEPSTVAA